MRIFIIGCFLILAACEQQQAVSKPLTPEQYQASLLQQQQEAIRQQNLMNAFSMWSGYQQQQTNALNAQVYHPQTFNCRSQNINGIGYMNCY